MARFRAITVDELPPDKRWLFDRPINLVRLLANSPGGAAAVTQLGSWIRNESRLDSRLRELAILTVGYVERSEYEFSHHVAIGLEHGCTSADIETLVDVIDGNGAFATALDGAVVEAARQLTVGTVIDDPTWESLASHLSPADLVDLVVVIGCYAMVVRLLGALQVPVEPDYRSYLERYGSGWPDASTAEPPKEKP